MTLRKLRTNAGRRRFLNDVPWLVLRADMYWDRWAYIHDNIAKCHIYFETKPSWVRAYRIYMLLHQMYAFCLHPDLKKHMDIFHQRMKELDKGKISEVEALEDYTSRVDMGLSAGELRRIKKLCTRVPNWRWNPAKAQVVQQVNARLKPKAY